VKTGVQCFHNDLRLLDSGFRRNDGHQAFSTFCDFIKVDNLVKSLKTVTPAEAGVQKHLNLLDSRFRGNDKIGELTTFYECIKFQLKNS
jgi:hypothetical protein